MFTTSPACSGDQHVIPCRRFNPTSNVSWPVLATVRLTTWTFATRTPTGHGRSNGQLGRRPEPARSSTLSHHPGAATSREATSRRRQYWWHAPSLARVLAAPIARAFSSAAISERRHPCEAWSCLHGHSRGRPGQRYRPPRVGLFNPHVANSIPIEPIAAVCITWPKVNDVDAGVVVPMKSPDQGVGHISAIASIAVTSAYPKSGNHPGRRVRHRRKWKPRVCGFEI